MITRQVKVHKLAIVYNDNNCPKIGYLDMIGHDTPKAREKAVKIWEQETGISVCASYVECTKIARCQISEEDFFHYAAQVDYVDTEDTGIE